MGPVPKTKKQMRAIAKLRAYAWVSYMITHQPEEMARVRKYGTPSDDLIILSEKRIEMVLNSGRINRICFPVSLNKSAGQKLLFEVLQRVDLHVRAIPIKAYELFQHVKTTVRHRRSDTERNLHIVAEAIMHRSATEFKTEILFAFDSINEWIKAVHGKALGYQTLRRSLEFLQEAGVLKIMEWGQKNNRHKATKIRIIPVTRKTVTTYTSEIDDWIMYNDHGMIAVYKRESATRQDVLENAVAHYADKVLRDISAEISERIRQEGTHKFLFKKAVKSTPVEVTTETEVSSDYFDRLLGELVPTVQENEPYDRQTSERIRGSGTGSEGGSRCSREHQYTGFLQRQLASDIYPDRRDEQLSDFYQDWIRN